MNIDKIRKRVTGGLAPFKLHTSDGREFKVPHPEFILFGRGVVVVVDEEGDPVMIDPLHIVAVKNFKPEKAKQT